LESLETLADGDLGVRAVGVVEYVEEVWRHALFPLPRAYLFTPSWVPLTAPNLSRNVHIAASWL